MKVPEPVAFTVPIFLPVPAFPAIFIAAFAPLRLTVEVPGKIVGPEAVAISQDVPVPVKFIVEFPRYMLLLLALLEKNTPIECVNPALSVAPSRCNTPDVSVKILEDVKLMLSNTFKVPDTEPTIVIPPKVVKPPFVRFKVPPVFKLKLSSPEYVLEPAL